mmetsp:Transcript_24214/g.67148  ORF Transcript_24214/g.67148 Transcript_24214/m.67148 type:complete len:80 (+) Transcript_24214:1513-1752(+)
MQYNDGDKEWTTWVDERRIFFRFQLSRFVRIESVVWRVTHWMKHAKELCVERPPVKNFRTTLLLKIKTSRQYLSTSIIY